MGFGDGINKGVDINSTDKGSLGYTLITFSGQHREPGLLDWERRLSLNDVLDLFLSELTGD